MSDENNAPQPVRVVQISETVQAQDHRGPQIHLTAVDDDGRVWERFSSDPPGVWHEVQRPTRPASVP